MQEIINILILIFVFVICTILLDLCYAKLNGYTIKFDFRTIVTTIFTVVFTVFNNLYVNYEMKIILTLIVLCVNFKLIFKDKIKRVILSFFILYSFILILEIILSNVLSFFININNYDVNYLTFIKYILSLITAIIEFVFFKIKVIVNAFKKFLDASVNYVNTINISVLMFFVVSIVGILNIQNFSKDGTMELIYILTIIFTILFYFLIKAKYDEKTLRLTNSKLIMFNENYSKFLDEYKIYKHNINHKLLAIKSYGNKTINSLIDELLNEETHFSIKNNNLYNVPIGIKGIVAEKLYNTKINVIINNEIKKDPFINLSPKAFNSISECIGIALDNAIEACKETNEPIITMELKENKEYILIKIGNNFSNNIDLEKLGNKYYSTKNRGSGLGLFSIMKNNLVKEKINIVNDFYSIELQIKKAR